MGGRLPTARLAHTLGIRLSLPYFFLVGWFLLAAEENSCRMSGFPCVSPGDVFPLHSLFLLLSFSPAQDVASPVMRIQLQTSSPGWDPLELAVHDLSSAKHVQGAAVSPRPRVCPTGCAWGMRSALWGGGGAVLSFGAVARFRSPPYLLLCPCTGVFSKTVTVSARRRLQLLHRAVAGVK